MPKVNYNGFVADVREESLKEGIACLSQCTRAERKQILGSVKKALDKALRFAAAGDKEFSERQLQDIANDIGIWFAGEVLAGRAEEYKSSVH